MKNLLHALSFLFLFPAFSYAQFPENGGEKIQTVINSSWTNGAWEKESKVIFTYNTDCNTNTMLIQNWEGDDWENSGLTTNTYLPNKKLNQSIMAYWMGDDWVPISRSTSFYNPSLQVIRKLNESFFTDWQPASQNNYTYDINGFLKSDLTENAVMGEFQNAHLTSYVNSAAGLVISEKEQTWSGVSWVNTDSTHYVINVGNQVLSSISFDWETDHWVNSSRSTGTYENGNLKVVVDEEWKDDEWINSIRTTLNYDGNNRIKSVVEQSWDIIGQDWVNELLSEYTLAADCSALPLTLLNFSGENGSGNVLLLWETTNETNTSGFNIQKSMDGVNFTNIANVASAGGKIKNKYSYEDVLKDQLPGTFYYRLQMVDLDGKFSFSHVIKMAVDAKHTLSLFPNPVRDQLMFLSGEDMKNGTISINGQDGRVLITKKFKNINGNTKNMIDVSVLPPGIYILRLKGESKVAIRKFIKK